MGLMIAEQAAVLGARTVCLDPSADAPAFRVCDDHIVAAFDDAAALEELCRRSDAVTYEFENVPGEILIPLTERYNIPQGYRPLFDSQDRIREKTNARDNGLRVPRFAEVHDRESLMKGIFEIGYPCVFKTRTLGYDGHGQAVIRTPEDIARAEPYLGVPAILEEFVPFDYEASIVMVNDGERIVSFPIGQNIHRDGILDLCIVPAPRMDDAVRARLLGEPLQEPRLVAPTVMKNILGEDLAAAEAVAAETGAEGAQSPEEGVYVHLYGKSVSKPKRKMGHITFVGMTAGEYDARWRGRFVE